VLAHCFAGWAHAFSSHALPGVELEEKGVVWVAVGPPPWVARVTGIAVLATLGVLAVVLVQKWRREGRLPIFTPLVAFLASVWAWSIYSGVDPLVRYMVPALHSVQYLYFVWMLQRNEARERERAPWFETSARVRLGVLVVSALGLGWVLFHLAPWALDDGLAPRRARLTDLGPTPCFAAL